MIQQGLGDPWPDEVQPAAQPFLQGHLIESPPFAYAADLRYPVWSLTRTLAAETAEDERGVEVVELDEEYRPPYGIISSQSCDLTEEDREPNQPWFGVYPVYKVATDSKLLNRDYIYRLDPPDLDEGPCVADMRIELPLEKGVLVGRTPIEAFPDEAGYIAFANAMARRRGRPALHSVFNEMLLATTAELNRRTSRKKQSRRVREKVHALRLAIEDGTRLKPAIARLYVVTQEEADDETRDWFGAWWDEARQVAEAHGLQLLPVSYSSGAYFDLDRYDTLTEVRSPL